MSKDKPMPSTGELLLSNMLELPALIRILERKDFITQDEILEKVREFKLEMDEKIRRMERKN